MPYELIERNGLRQPNVRFAPSIVTVAIALIAKGTLALLDLVAEADFRMQRQRTRRFLGELTEHELHDIGLTRAQARHEAGRPWWM